MKTRFIVIIFFAILLGQTCSGIQEPEFVTIDHLSIQMVSINKLTASGEAVFNNPNAIGGKLTATDIVVLANDIPVGEIKLRSEITIPAKAEFRLPLTFDTSPSAIYKDNTGGLLGGVLNAVLDKKVLLRYEGQVSMKLAGVPYTTPIEYEEEIALKK